MRSLFVTLLAGLACSACQNGCQRTLAPDADQPSAAWTAASLQAFDSDDALNDYLDTVAYSQTSEGAAQRPECTTIPRRSRPAGSAPDRATWREMFGVRSWGPASERQPRLALADGKVYSLYNGQLRSFAFQPHSQSLVPLDVLDLGRPIEVLIIDQVPIDGHSDRGGKYVVGRSFATTSVWDHVFASPDGVHLVGNRQDSSDIEIMQVYVDARGRPTPAYSYHVSVIPPEVDGYRARMVEGVLALYFVHEIFYDDRGERVHALPGLEATGGLKRLRAQDVYRPLLHTNRPALHVMLRCDASSPPVNCASHALIGTSAELHMGSDAAYLWLVGQPDMERASSAIARLPYDGSAPTAVRIDGTRPAGAHEGIRELGDSLYVVSARRGASELALVRIPRSQFAESAPYVADMHYRRLLEGSPSDLRAMRPRFADHQLVLDTDPPIYWQMGREKALATSEPAIDSLALGENVVLIRREDQLIVQRLSPELTELQRLSLSP